VDKDLEDVVLRAWDEVGGSTPLQDRRDAPLIVRPDVVSTSPDHEEWMTYLSNLRRPVTPRPNAVGHVTGVYVFEDEERRVRWVDTGTGLSRVVDGLDRVPERVAYGGYPKESHPMLLFDPDEKPYASIRVARVDGGELRLEPSIPVERPVSHYYKETKMTSTGLLGSIATEMELGLVFERDDQYIVLWPGRWEQPETVPKPFGQNTIAVMESSRRVYALDKRSGHVKVIGEPGPNDPLAQPIVNITQLLRARPLNDLVVVGESQGGKPAVGLLGGKGWHAYELPEGAIVQDVYWPGDMYRFRVTYTLRGEPVEPESLKEQEFLPLEQKRLDAEELRRILSIAQA
jgi:hypothetical protein